MDNEERKEAEADLNRQDKTERVTLAIAERSIEGAWCEGYRVGVFDMAAIALAALSVYALIRIMSSE
jgi:hypothetical protein